MPLADPERRRAYQREWARRRRAQILAGAVCLRCGATENLELHHFVPDEKETHRVTTLSRARQEAELAKCVVLCDPCHNSYHAASRVKHGVKRYERGCRCDICREAKAQANRRFRARAARALERTGGLKVWTILALALALAPAASAGTEGTLARATGLEVRCVDVIPGVPAAGQRPSGMYGAGVVWLRADHCQRITLDLERRYARKPISLVRRGLSWLVLAHEVAHHYGYDHGETTLPADCAGFRFFLSPLMRAAGLPAGYADRLWRAVKTTGPCVPWEAV